MPGAHVTLQLGPSTYNVSQAVVGGQLVEPDGSTGMIKPCTAGSLKCLGVARGDAQPAGSNPTNPLNMGWPLAEVAVIYGPAEVDCTYANAATFGATLIAAANGQVTPAGATPDASAIVGRCAEPNGVGSGAVGRTRLR